MLSKKNHLLPWASKALGGMVMTIAFLLLTSQVDCVMSFHPGAPTSTSLSSAWAMPLSSSSSTGGSTSNSTTTPSSSASTTATTSPPDYARRNTAMILGVRPTMAHAPRWLWLRAWRLHDAILPLLHLFDTNETAVVENKNALKVLWCKGLASDDPQSSPWCYDPDHWTYDLLPPITRWFLLRLLPAQSLFPRLHHANIEFRTVFLNRRIQQEIARLPTSTRVRLVTLGAGYDVRLTRLLSSAGETIEQAWELDLPVVVEAKQRLLDRLQQRRTTATVRLPQLRPVNLNDITAFQGVLDEIFSNSNDKNEDPWHTIVIAEGVLMFLDDGIPSQIFQSIANKCRHSTASFCFADHLVRVQDVDEEQALVNQLFLQAGWGPLVEWGVKPGKARQMGCVRTKLMTSH